MAFMKINDELINVDAITKVRFEDRYQESHGKHLLVQVARIYTQGGRTEAVYIGIEAVMARNILENYVSHRPFDRPPQPADFLAVPDNSKSVIVEDAKGGIECFRVEDPARPGTCRYFKTYHVWALGYSGEVPAPAVVPVKPPEPAPVARGNNYRFYS